MRPGRNLSTSGSFHYWKILYRLVTQGTIEEQIVDLHHHKRDLADRLLEGADAPARLNAEELLNLLRQPLN